MSRRIDRLSLSLSLSSVGARFAAVVVIAMVAGAGCDGAGSTPRDGGADGARDAGKSGGRSGGDAGPGSGGSVAATGGAGTTASGGNSGGLSGATGGAGGHAEGGAVGTGGAGVGGRSGSGGATTSTGGATASSGGAGGVTVATGGQGMTGAGERPGTGGAHTGGMPGTGGASATGGASTGSGGAGTGGAATGGAATGGANTGGANTGSGGAGTGGANTGGANTGGANTGGANTGGAHTGGANTGGANTGGAHTGGAGTGGAGTGGAGTGGVGGGAGASLYVVAHPDDDLLFMNPFIETDIQAGRRVTTVYVTSGDGSDGPFPNREPRIMSAGAAMGGVADVPWNCATHVYAGKSVKSCSLAGKPLVGAIFLRLLDGDVTNLRSGARVNTADGSTSYNEAELLATLQAIIVDVQPGRVGVMDASMLDNAEVEHTDHVASAIYAFDAARSDGVARQLLMFRGYTTYFDPPPPAHEPQNISTADYNEKRRVMVVYLGGSDPDGTYDNWLRRTYAYTGASPATVSLQHGSQCLEPAATTAGSTVRMVACNGASAGQAWTLGANSRVVGAGGLCLDIGGGGGAELQTCDNGAGQRWTLMSNGQLRGTRVSCLDVAGTSVSSADCDGTTDSANKFVPVAAQRWTAVP